MYAWNLSTYFVDKFIYKFIWNLSTCIYKNMHCQYILFQKHALYVHIIRKTCIISTYYYKNMHSHIVSRDELPSALWYLIIMIIIYHDVLPPPRRGCHVKSDNTHTLSSTIHPLAHILNTCTLIFSSCVIFTVYPNRVMQRHPTPLKVKTTRAREGGPKEHRAKHGRVKLIQLHMYQDSPLFPIFCALTRSLHRHSSVAQGHLHTIHPAYPVSLVPALHLLPPSTPFWPYGAHPFFRHA